MARRGAQIAWIAPPLCTLSVMLAAGCGGGAAPSRSEVPGGEVGPDRRQTVERRALHFVEMTEEAGLRFVHRTGSREDYFMPAIMGGGAAVFDYDDDDDLDLYLVSSGDPPPGGGRPESPPSRLLQQREDGRYVDVTEGSGLRHTGYGMGAAVGDVDNDGDPDLFVTTWGADVLFRNNADGTFSEVASSGLSEEEGWSTSAAFLDFDRDGWLDLYVARYVDLDPARACALEGGRRDYCGPAQFAGSSDLLYRNLGNGRFADHSRAAGLTTVAEAGLGIFCADFDDDGWIDVYVANDGGANHLWLNQGDGTFVDDALLLGVAFNRYGVGEAGMGVVAGDGDGDGDLDLFLTHLGGETNTYYENRGRRGFDDVTAKIGLAVPSVPYTGFGTALFDYDNDGDLDLAVANGSVKRRGEPLGSRPEWFWNDYAEPNQLFENRGRGVFVEVSAAAGELASRVEVSRGLLPADLDADGDPDLLVTQIEGPARLYRNPGVAGAGWVEIRAFDPALGREALGAKVVVDTGRRRYVRHLVPPGGYLTSGHPRAHLGLGAEARIERLEIRWPDGELEVFGGVGANRVVELRRGHGRPIVGEG